MLIVALAAGFAWLTRHPDVEILARAQQWPLVGALAKGFRDAYLQPKPSLPPDDSGTRGGGDLEVEWRPDRPEDFDARPYIWVQPGDLLYEKPDSTSPVLLEVDSIRNLALVEQRDDWFRVRVPRPGEHPREAWVYFEDYEDPSPEVLHQPEPVVPLPASQANPDSIAAARELMQNQGRETRCGPYRLFTDTVPDDFLDLCTRTTADLERIYRERYGLDPVSPPSEAIFLFRQDFAYQAFRDREQIPFESSLAHASPANGYVALYRGERSTRDVLGTLVHELTHLLNRRALGPALPPWLSEGLADDLAESRIDEDGSLEVGQLGGDALVEGSSVTRFGAVAAAIDLQEALEAEELPRLETLMQMDRQQFHEPEWVQLHYALSSFWVRYLASGFDIQLTEAFKVFLREVRKGEPLTQERFEATLGSRCDDLESGFRIWLRLQFLVPPSEMRSESP